MSPWPKRRERLLQSAWGRLFLSLLSLVYGAAVSLRRLLYEAGILKSRETPAAVISIGNLTAGGTGKTPAALLAAHTLKKLDLPPIAILSRGYGRSRADSKVSVLVEEDGKDPPTWDESGDEPWMMHQALKGTGIPILVCANRAQAADAAITFYHSRVLILDDGFQHLKLRRDLDVVLVSALDPFGGGHLLPRGLLREPLWTLSRADLILITHADQVPKAQLEAAEAEIRRRNSKAEILHAAHRPDFLLDLLSGRKLPPSDLAGEKVAALSGLADPLSFERTLEDIGTRIEQTWRYPDHHPYRLGELRSVENARRGMPLVTTLKDFTRFPPSWDSALKAPAFALSIKLHILKGRDIWNETLEQAAREAARKEEKQRSRRKPKETERVS